MHLKSISLLAVAACALAACGGGGGGAVNSTPTPTPTPGATPTPTPVNTTLVNLQYSQSFEGRGAINPFTITRPSGNATSSGTPINRQIEVRYDARTSSYTLVTGDRPDATFGPAERTSASTAVITVYERVNGANTQNFILFNPGPANTSLALTYVSYGAWQTIIDNGASLAVDSIFFVHGLKTSPADLPKTGSASYQTIIDGQFAGSTGVYTVGGSSNFSADFGAGTVAFGMTLTGRNVVNSTLKNFGTINGTGTINSLTSGFDASSGVRPAGSYGVSMLGQFFGPGAAEMGGSFQLMGSDGMGNGAIVGKKN